MPTRHLSPYEQTHLRRYGFDLSQLDNFGDTPVEYLTGRVEFAGRTWQVSPATLIPRVETEELLDLAKQHLPAPLSTLTWLELGTGSGALGLSWAAHVTSKTFSHHGWLTDISSEALAIAQQNYQELTTAVPTINNLTFLKSDLLTELPVNQKFNLVLANLPYIPSSDLDHVDPSVKEYEPYLALDGGPTGFEIIARALFQLKTRLEPAAQIWLEVDPQHTPNFVTEYWQAHFQEPWPVTWQLSGYSDQFGRHRFLLVESG